VERRAFLGAVIGGLLAATLAVEAQQSRNLPVVGVLTPAPGESPTGLPGKKDPLPLALREFGYAEGTSIHIEYRSSALHDERFPALVSELTGL
jgi:hypothetical protein